MWPVVSLPQNVRHFLCKQQGEWLLREQREVSRPPVPRSNTKLAKLETGVGCGARKSAVNVEHCVSVRIFSITQVVNSIT